MSLHLRTISVAALLLSAAAVAFAQSQEPAGPPVVGRWDITVTGPDGRYPSWLDVQASGERTLVGYFVGQFGSVRPISEVFFQNGEVRFSLPPQWESGNAHLTFEGKLAGDRLSGNCTDAEGHRGSWTAVRAPALRRSHPPVWGTPVDLVTHLAAWRPRDPNTPSGWSVDNGVLRNRRPGNDLVTRRSFTDFKLHAEFRYPRGSNSGIYLRGRYEVQIEDDYGLEPDPHMIGGIYGFLAPRVISAKRAGEWQAMDVTLVGRRVTVVLNGETVIDRAEIPGITGGALDSDEGAPGPLMIQGDHGPIDFRRFTVTPGR